ncbi:hypothetical protein ACQPTN_10995 [Bradyrhizobium sp. 13971]
MARRSKFRFSKAPRIRGYFQRMAKYESDDIDRFRDLVDQERTRQRKQVQRRAAALSASMQEFLADQAHELDTVSRLADELSIVALYRIVEINTSRMVAHEFGLAAKRDAAYLPRLKNLLFTRKGLVLDTVPHYRAINELRLLNNAIKHAGVVTDELANGYSRWHKGDELKGLDKAYMRLRPKVPIYILRLAQRMKLK